MAGHWRRITDPEMHKRIVNAIEVIFDHVDPKAILTEPCAGQVVNFDSEGQAEYGWYLYKGAGVPGATFYRADYSRVSDPHHSTSIAADSGQEVLFGDTRGATAETTVAGLERFAKHVAGDGKR